MDDPVVALGAQMKAARDGLSTAGPRFSPEAMARALKVTRDTIVRWESGEVKPPFDRLVAYCRVLRTRGFPGKDALKIICLGYPTEVSELQRCTDVISDDKLSKIEAIEVAIFNLIEEIGEVSGDFVRGSAYFDSIFNSVAEALSERRIMMEAWSHCYGLSDYKAGDGYRFRSGFRIGWTEFSDEWHIALKIIEERTYDEAFLGYQYNSIFENEIRPIAQCSLSVKQRAAAELPMLLEELKTLIMQIPSAHVRR